ncbi:MAG: type II methionyl aminopeptidase [Thermoplasmata archaeon]
MTSDVIKKYLKAGKAAAKALERGKDICAVDKPYFDVVQGVEEVITDEGALPAFPVNVSVNNVGAHYTPYPGDGMLFKRGDVVKIDVGCHVDGYIADNAATVELGTRRYTNLIDAAEEALSIAVNTIREGVKVGEVGNNIESIITNKGYVPIKNLSGHAIERYELHAGLSIPNVGGGREKIKKGMVLAVEPFATDGKGKVVNDRPSEILRLRGERRLKGEDLEFYKWLEQRFDNLPFASYWCKSYGGDYSRLLKRVRRFGAVMSYPILLEAKNGIITQRENTMIVTSKGARIITK